MPDAAAGWVALDQFRDADGSPIYPQRSVTAPIFSGAVSGNTPFDGSINGKMIAVSNLTDTDALPLHTDWYRQRVEESLGNDASSRPPAAGSRIRSTSRMRWSRPANPPTGTWRPPEPICPR